MTIKNNIVFVEQYYYPEGWSGAQLPRDITVELAKSGLRVAVLCGRDQYVPVTDDATDDPRVFGISIHYAPRLAFSGHPTKSVIGQAWFCIAVVCMVCRRRRPAAIIVQTNPPLIVVALSALATMIRRPLIIIAQDLYPEVMFAHDMLSRHSLPGRLLSRVFGWAYRRATCVISLGPCMTGRILHKGVPAARIREISNWATGDLEIVRGTANQLLTEWNLQNKFVLLYSGNLGVAHDCETILRAVAEARASLPQLRLVIIGKGGRIPEMDGLVRERGLADVVMFRPLVPPELLPQTLGVADLALVTLRPGFEGLVVPSKLLGHMARGVPTLFVGPEQSDVADLIARSGGGFSVRNGEWAAITARLVELANDKSALERMGTAAKAYYREFLSREIGLSSYRSVINQIVAGELSQ
jgi:colanic acid biosynthesis glycosyl transferase WcaI